MTESAQWRPKTGRHHTRIASRSYGPESTGHKWRGRASQAYHMSPPDEAAWRQESKYFDCTERLRPTVVKWAMRKANRMDKMKEMAMAMAMGVGDEGLLASRGSRCGARTEKSQAPRRSRCPRLSSRENAPVRWNRSRLSIG